MTEKLVKICGIRRPQDATAAINSGADILGVIMVPNRQRTIAHEDALEISKAVHAARDEKHRKFKNAKELNSHIASQSFASHEEYLLSYHDLILQNGPFLTGVFRNQDPKTVFELAEQLNLDIIQLHGSEDPAEFMALNTDNKFCIVKRFVLPEQTEYMTNFLKTLHTTDNKGFALPLLDSELGGEGKTIDLSLINDLQGSFILAGGLTPDNLKNTKDFINNVVGFDVSGGVEDDSGFKDHNKISQFVAEGKKLSI
ncbi:hypothetical protein FT663_02407 [Candidozyma haemuli var. vulneris]|uniref:N-(5'-phosphoribosyl)anthranilate isomerase n=1 Tax=Candidozyma haemuli TaxID=45357 RepID=A0A2V1AYM1_9ASCO|nr:hypothetical protein CXQ85_002919 [[Candida] haemuloni]KAF3985577.1 hypothetical protein FT662_05069 [[Candida] haemuloni var. vulneris]KAF3992217.1 hypothetical protein FT663_02407 [[Candida] haemuloni var. vulneris]PVH23190.1 hypothetical protein CXQ85_002919 [[Candida] haemuloni]